VRNAEFLDPRLVAVYDAQFPWPRDDDFFLATVNETPGAWVPDLSYGTRRLTLAIAAAGHTVTDVDSAPAMLVAARAKAGAELITRIEGTSAVLPASSFDSR
jgi:ubiquinone/menaquinone biosynthesis C-methylase UbiE